MRFYTALLFCCVMIVAGAARADGQPYQLKGTEVWTIPDPVSKRTYEILVAVPASYAQNPNRRYPVLYVTDADYAFPVIRSITNRVRNDGKALEDFILVGLSYALNDSPVVSRNRDYTPMPGGSPSRKGLSTTHGQAENYRNYLQNEVLPFVEQKFRTDPNRGVLMGHSYGGLFGAYVLLTTPDMFSDYIIGSPSLWYEKRHMFDLEQEYAAEQRDLPANVSMYIGSFETVRNEPRYNRNNDMVGDMKKFMSILTSRGYPNLTIAADIVSGEDHLTVFPSGFTRSLLAVLPAK